jgi:hypothetical protein
MRFALLLLTALLLPSPGAHGAEAKNSQTQTCISPPCTCTAIVQPPIPPQEHDPQQQPQNWYKNWHRGIVWFWPPIWSNWALVVAAVWAGCIALSTLRKIEEQTEATKEAAEATRESIPHQAASAKAAALNARAIMNAERAWVLVDVRQPSEDDMKIAEIPDRREGLGIGFNFKNHGRTVARIKDSYIRAIIVPAIDPHGIPAVPQLSVLPDYLTEKRQIVERDTTSNV